MEKFNLQKAKEGKPVRTKNGYPARIICFDASGNRPLVALVAIHEGEPEQICTYREDGKYEGSRDSDFDLEMDTVKRTGYINLYKGRTLYKKKPTIHANIVYDSESEAKKQADIASGYYISTVRIEWEE